jgi:ParB-like chromosome segregation protein Spo0J
MSDPTKIGSVVALPPAEVEIGWRARGDLGDIDALAQNIRELGQLQPGLVAHQPGKRKPYLLVAGGRRLEAAKRVQVPFQAVVISQSEEVRLLE